MKSTWTFSDGACLCNLLTLFNLFQQGDTLIVYFPGGQWEIYASSVLERRISHKRTVSPSLCSELSLSTRGWQPLRDWSHRRHSIYSPEVDSVHKKAEEVSLLVRRVRESRCEMMERDRDRGREKWSQRHRDRDAERESTEIKVGREEANFDSNTASI